MKHLKELIFLIDASKAMTGSDYRTAQALGVSRGNVSDWRKGTRPCPPEYQVLMAALAGFDPQATAARALVEKHEGTPLGDQLMRALGKASRAIGAALGFAGVAALATFSLPTSTARATSIDTMYIKRKKRYVKGRPALARGH